MSRREEEGLEEDRLQPSVWQKPHTFFFVAAWLDVCGDEQRVHDSSSIQTVSIQLDRYGYLAAYVSFIDVVDGFGGFAQRVSAIHDRHDFAGLDEFLEKHQVTGVRDGIAGGARP
jgi:hypothetical protein